MERVLGRQILYVEFYKKIIKTSKVIREIYEKNRDKSFREIVEIAEKEIKMNPFLLHSLQFA